MLPELVRKLDWIDREELVRRLMLLEHRRLLDYYESEETIEEADDKGRLSGEGKEGKKRDKRNAVAEEGMKRLFINFGKLDRMFPNKLIELINKCVPGRVKIGKIDLLPRFAFFEVEEADAQEVIRSMSSYEVDGRRIAVDYADAMGGGDGKKERRSVAIKTLLPSASPTVRVVRAVRVPSISTRGVSPRRVVRRKTAGKRCISSIVLLSVIDTSW